MPSTLARHDVQASPWSARILPMFAALLLLLAAACGSGGGGTAPAAAPKIQSFSPASGSAGTTLVTLKGTGLTGVTAVRFGTVAAETARGDGDGQVIVPVPAGAVSGAITVVTPAGSHTSSDTFTIVPSPVPPPAVTGFEPAQGWPGQAVVVSGTALAGASQVSFGGVAAVDFWHLDDTHVHVVVPEGAVTGPVAVWTPAGSGASQAGFTVLPRPVPAAVPPVVTAFTPGQGAPGTRIEVAGNHLDTATQVDFGGVAGVDLEVRNDHLLAVTVPRHAVTGPLTVATSGGAGASASDFTVLAAPALGVTGMDPIAGPVGTQVTLTGTGLAGATGVAFGGVAAADLQVLDDTTVTAVVPAGAVTGPVSVRVAAGLHLSPMDFTVTGDAGAAAALPTLSGAEPDHGAPGTRVTLTGTGILAVDQVDFGGVAAPEFRVLGDTTLVVVVPDLAVTGPVTVVTRAGMAALALFTVDPVLPPPVVGSVSPAQGAPGTVVTISGSGFVPLDTQVLFGGFMADLPDVSPDGTTLTAVVPATGLSGPVMVVAPGGNAVSGAVFTVLPAPGPAVTGVSASRARPGDRVSFTGTNLDQVVGVAFSGANGQVVSHDLLERLPGKVTLAVPDGVATGPWSLLTHGGPVAIPGSGLSVLPALPVILDITPLQGVPGTEVTITGRHLLDVQEVAFAGTALDRGRFSVDSDTQVRVRIPDAGLPGQQGVIQVSTSAGTAATLSSFTFLPSRIGTLGQDLVRTGNAAGSLTLLDFPALRRAAPYNLELPQAPVFHPIDPAVNPDCILNLKLGGEFYPAIPPEIRTEIERRPIDRANVDILVVSQHRIDDPLQYQFKPQYWAFQDAPCADGADSTGNAVVGLFEAPGGAAFDVTRFSSFVPNSDVMFFQRFGLTLESGSNRMVATGPVMTLNGLAGEASCAFWTLTVFPGKDKAVRAAATLHLLLDDDDQGLLAGASADPALTSTALVFRNLSDGGFGPVASLAYLARPVAARADRSPVLDLSDPEHPVDTHTDEIRLWGDMFLGVEQVFVNDDLTSLSPDSFMVYSGSRMRVLVPRSLTGVLKVQTPLGQSDDIPLPPAGEILKP